MSDPINDWQRRYDASLEAVRESSDLATNGPRFAEPPWLDRMRWLPLALRTDRLLAVSTGPRPLTTSLEVRDDVRQMLTVTRSVDRVTITSIGRSQHDAFHPVFDGVMSQRSGRTCIEGAIRVARIAWVWAPLPLVCLIGSLIADQNRLILLSMAFSVASIPAMAMLSDRTLNRRRRVLIVHVLADMVGGEVTLVRSRRRRDRSASST